MKGKIVKRLTVLLAIICLFGCNVSYIYAEENNLYDEVSETETDEEFAEDTTYSVALGAPQTIL